MNRRWANCHRVAIVLVLCVLCPGLAQGQADLDVFQDVGLSELDDQIPAEELPAPQELPSGPRASSGEPSIDTTAPDLTAATPASDSAEPLRDPADERPSVKKQDPDVGAADVEPDEIIRERYSDGKIRIERGVRQDELQNYMNHGSWKTWDPQGRLVMEGTYRDGQPEGSWTRWSQAGDAELYRQSPFKLFEGPFVSHATFRGGQLHGYWIVTDQNERKICDWSFVDGRRDGKSLWWYQNGNKMREINYADGQVHGELLEWDEGGKLVTRVEYQEGRRLAQTIQKYKTGQQQYEGMVLHAKLILKQPDNWWKTTLATYVQEGKDQKHGEWVAWYADGKEKFAGQYEYDRPAGQFTWWHSNGQRALEGSYQDGRQQGSWTWWHENGQRSIQGQYQRGTAIDRWVWWHESGKVAQRVDFTASGGQVVTAAESRLDIDGESIGRSIMLNRPQNGGESWGGGE